MSEYYLADRQAEQRSQRRELGQQAANRQEKQRVMKITVLGDFLFPSKEPQGCDPYNSTCGKSERELWRLRSERR